MRKDLPNNLLLSPSRDNPVGTHWPNAVNFLRAMRFGFDHVEDLLAKNSHKFLGVDPANAMDHS